MNRRDMLAAGAAAGLAGVAAAPAPAAAAPRAAGFTASWAHGNAVVVETPGAFSSITRFGWGTDMQLKAGQGSWVHIPVPTPVISEGRRAKLVKAFLFYLAAQNKVQLTHLHVFDGPGRVFAAENLHYTGDNSAGLNSFNSWAVPSRDVLWGLGVTARFDAPAGGGGLLRITTAGVDLAI